jgi:23S rRNA pseudouridine1911/1915/1917 synthase
MVEPPHGRVGEGQAQDAELDESEAPDADAAPERRTRVVDAALHGQRLDKALVALAPEFSRNHLQSLIAAGHVRVDGAVRTTAARRLAAGQRLEVERVRTAESLAFRPEAMALTVVY